MGKNDKVIVGYRYHLGFHMVLCHYGAGVVIKEIYSGERLVWSGTVSSSQSIYLDKIELFGGDRKEGGIQGLVDCDFGEPTQTKNDYLMTHIGPNIPAFRGVVSFIAKTLYVAANNPYIKPWWIRVTNIVQSDWYSAKADILSGSANAAHIIRECLVNEDWGLETDESDLDDASFRIFADTLYDEEFGLSMLLASQDQTDRFIQEVLRHVQGVIYNDRTTGKYVIKLIRDDYDIGTLQTFDESNILSVESYDKPSPGELLDEVIVQYRPRNAAQDYTVSYHNLAVVESQRSVVSKPIKYPGIDKHSNAARAAARELRQASSKVSKAKLKVNREAWELNPGDVFKFSWSALGIVVVIMRVVKINFGKLDSPTIVVDVVEDVFALSQASYLDPEDTSWTVPLYDPIALTYRRIEEQNWWDLVLSLDQANLNLVTSTSSYIKYMGIEPAVVASEFELWTKPAGGNYGRQAVSKFSPQAFLTNSISEMDKIDIDISNLDVIEVHNIAIGGYAIIDEEYFRIDSINVSLGLMSVGRGCLDTVPALHSSGIRVWFADENLAKDYTEYSNGETIYGKALTVTGIDVLDISLAPEDSIVVNRRQHKPYPPGQFRFNAVYYPIVFVGVLTISWAHRDRLQQTATIIDHEYGNIGPEASVTYTLDLYDQNNVLVKTYTGLTGTSQAWTTEVADSGRVNNRVRAVLKAVRSAVDSHQSHDFTVNRAGYGFLYGQYYGGI
jgi:hypothetical protein